MFILVRGACRIFRLVMKYAMYVMPWRTLWASQEANPLYPVPVIFKRSDFRKLYKAIREENHE